MAGVTSVAALLFPAILIAHQQPQNSPTPDPTTVLLEARDKVNATLNRLPRYLCTETIDRSNFEPLIPTASCSEQSPTSKEQTRTHARQTTTDRLRLDVAIASSGEMYSWVGEDRFGDHTLFDLAGYGAVETGTFASFLISLFATNAASFTYNRDLTISTGRHLNEYGFHVPLQKSHYDISKPTLGTITVAYHGTVLIDPQTFDLIRLDIQAELDPKEIDLCQASTSITYSTVKFSHGDFQLPIDIELQLLHPDGTQSDSQTAFSRCREFSAQSTLSFENSTPLPSGPAAGRTAAPIKFTPGLPVVIVVDHAIDSTIAAAGDLVMGRLAKPIAENGNVLAPKGAAVRLRIVQLEQYYEKGLRSLHLGMKAEAIERNGVFESFSASLISSAGNRPRPRTLPGSPVVLGTFSEMRHPEITMLVFNHVNYHHVIKRGLELSGVIIAPKAH